MSLPVAASKNLACQPPESAFAVSWMSSCILPGGDFDQIRGDLAREFSLVWV